jgi:hypothetical protein
MRVQKDDTLTKAEVLWLLAMDSQRDESNFALLDISKGAEHQRSAVIVVTQFVDGSAAQLGIEFVDEVAKLGQYKRALEKILESDNLINARVIAKGALE